ncbi:hypothetical protein [Comamonas endophytica]|uniref:Uncharacterized protein n=1 Tax=Comamonas endophytica TaxID=2949090 RepID=A0ABY6GH64_9BURK|nr:MULTISPECIES: hypothetical protein [unclassified Acidovorax]MCD2514418.1 hypothetical protein [Acidovorax sp. D4N7]UYG53707.1 hypothetical protein M9799_17380 [Acidovorax sp. 5MLIR]
MTGITEALKCCLAAAALGGLSLPAVAAPAPEAFWSLVGKLAAATPQGAQAVARQWPGKPLAAAGAAQVSSAPLAVAPDLQTAIAEVRVAEDDAVQLMVLELRGRCITPADLGARYRQVRNADFPQPDNPDPVSYRRVQIDGVRVSFGFRGAAPGCLSHVVFNPAPD